MSATPELPLTGSSRRAWVDPRLTRLTPRLGDALVLSAPDVRDLLTMEQCIAAVENGFRILGEEKAQRPGALSIHTAAGNYHIKAGAFKLGRPYFAAKTNANFPANPARYGLPTIQGLIVLFDGERGTPLAVMDSADITRLRTGAATAVAAKYLAREDASVATICGCGVQSRSQLRAVVAVRPVRCVYAVSRDGERAANFAREMSAELGIDIEVASDLGTAARASDIIIMCTPSRRALLGPNDVSPGAFVAGVGADSPEKQELDPTLLARAAVVVDILEQAAVAGDLHHAIEGGVMTRDDVRAELGEVVAGRRPGRVRDDEIVVFDSTGTAMQDVVAAAAVYEAAAAKEKDFESKRRHE